MTSLANKILCVAALGLLSATASAYQMMNEKTPDSQHEQTADSHHDQNMNGEVCSGFGPQTPRDIDSLKGSNKQNFSRAPSSKNMNLCNIHFHKNAEHKAKAFAIYAGDGDGHGFESGYQCGISKKLSKKEMAPTAEAICKTEHGELLPGDTIEVHWVHSSCDVKPGATLGACMSPTCSNPDLRVETQVFTLVNDSKALNFKNMDFDGKMVNGFYQAKSLPSNTGKPVEFTGSTTGPKYNNQTCSPLQVTWSVRPQCAKLDINSVGAWCKSNAFSEDHAHGVRKLVTDPKLLSNIKK